MRLDARGGWDYDASMTERRPGTPAKGDRDARLKAAPTGRDARLKAALKANIARRKARAQVLDAEPPPEDPHGDAPLAPPEEN